MRLYTVSFENVSVSAAQDFFEIQPADDKPVIFHGFMLYNVGGTSDAGDAQEELLRCLVRRGHATSGSGGSAPTPRPTASGNTVAAGFTAEVNNTTIASTGTTHDIHPFGFNVRVPYEFFWTPETRPTANQGDTTIVIRLITAPADAVSMSGVLYVEELS